MAKDLFSVPIFFILFRESLEASIICSVLLSLIEQIVKGGNISSAQTSDGEGTETTMSFPAAQYLVKAQEGEPHITQKQLLRRLRLQVITGALTGLFIAIAIGAAFIAVYFTEVKDLWADSEELWEGIFSLIASMMIFVMSLAMLKMDRAKAKWRYKLQAMFERQHHEKGISGGRFGKYALFLLPLVTVLREGLEAVVFVGGVSLGESATSIPIAAIVGLICGLSVGGLIYFGSRRINISIFLVISTCFLLLIGAGLFSKSVGDFERYKYNKGVGSDVGEAGNGPGSFNVLISVWHLTYGNPENNTAGQGWSIFNAIFGWTNNATYGSILSYVAYWIATVAALVWMKWSEGRMTVLGKESAARQRRHARRAQRAVDKSQGTETPYEEKKLVDDLDGPSESRVVNLVD